MVSHKMRLLFLCSGLALFSVVAKGEIIKDCDLIRQAKLYGAKNPQLVLEISDVESSKNSKVISRQDSHNVHYGLMQVKLGTARMLGFKGHPKDLLQWKTNLKLGIDYLDEKLEKHHSMQAAAAAYNAGAVYICRKGKVCKRGSFTNQGYVDLVMAHYRKYAKLQCLDPTRKLANK